MVQKFKRHRLICLLFLFALLLNFIPERTVNTMRAASIPLLDVFGRIASLVSTASGKNDNPGIEDTIKKQRRRINNLLAEIAAKDEEIRRLKKLVSDSNQIDGVLGGAALKFVNARVRVRRDMSNFRRTLIIGRGRADGIREGMLVVSGRCIVGIISTAGDESSQVQLLVDPAFRMRVKIPGGGREGIAEGTGGRDFMLKLKYVRTAFAPKKGEPVLTSGMCGRVPPDFLVGEVSEADGSPEGDFFSIRVKPAVHWRGLDVVQVLLTEPVSVAGGSR